MLQRCFCFATYTLVSTSYKRAFPVFLFLKLFYLLKLLIFKSLIMKRYLLLFIPIAKILYK